MAGRPKRRLDYAGWSVDIFDGDAKIDKLLDAQGWIGFSIYFFLCQMAYKFDGYFYRWGYDDCASTARRMGCGIGSGTVRETVGYCLQIGLFDQGLFDGWGVLTSKGIQRSFWTVAKSRRDKTVYKELWLLDQSESEGVIFAPFFSDMSATNSHSHPTNADMSATNNTVVKESKEYINTLCKADASALFERLWKLYPLKKGKGQVSDAKKRKLLEIGFDEMSRAIKRYKSYVDGIGYLHYQNGSTFFNSGYLDYLDENYCCGQESTVKKDVPDRRNDNSEDDEELVGDDW